ncbi:MAG: methyltransferase domain-containing protein [Bacteroidetes bacterium]|nr:16S rRNA (cytosine(1402)-N(4))-methyltransferase [Rhodothermaceae bacterium RA]RMH63053.1 MAG: methyltransferase domain-containing protein [Bacteroidota bacterium]
MASLPRVLDVAHALLAEVLAPGAVAIDATLGNGHDTLFLARQVGPGGHVYGFDVQQAALDQTRRRLAEAGLVERCTLFRRGHEQMAEVLPAAVRGRVQAVTFNLGYLPGGPDRSVITRPATTLPALEASLALLAPGGRLTVVLYTGHPGGADEARAVEDWAASLDPQAAQVVRYACINNPRNPPILIAVAKASGSP